MSVLHLDLETASAADLKKVGTHVYFEHASTKIWCAAWAFDGDADVSVWLPGEPCPPRLAAHVRAGGTVAAHNAAFERSGWNALLGPRHGWPTPSYAQYDCTAARAAVQALPRSLEGAAFVMGQAEQKDSGAGKKNMLQMARPRQIMSPEDKAWPALFAELVKAGGDHPGITKLPSGDLVVWWYSQDRLQRQIEYCKDDVRAEIGLHKRLRPLSAFEKRLFVLDAKINDRGLLVDHASIANAQQIISASSSWLTAEMGELTGGLKPSQRAAVVSWLEGRGISYAKPDSKPKTAVEDAPDEEPEAEIEALDKEALETMLARDNLEPDVRRVLEIRLEAGKSAHTKLDAMLRRSCKDGRIRGNFLYAGAHTLRWSGQGVQFQNLMRPSGKYDIMAALDEIVSGASAEFIQCFFGPPLSLVGENIRGMIVAAPGKEFVTGDFSNIEGRVNAWLAGEETKLEAFRAFDDGTGPDLYLVAAAGIYKRPIEDFNKKSPERQIGKVSELSMGYAGGVGAFQKMSKNYGVRVPDEQAEAIKKGWREAHPNIVRSWYAMQDAAFAACDNPGTPVSCCDGKLQFIVHGAFLWVRMPSGGLLAYARPEVREVSRKVIRIDPDTGKQYEEVITRPAVTYWAVDSKTKRWKRHAGYSGIWCENFVQRIARDLLAEALLRIDARGWDLVLHAHDEGMIESVIGSVTLAEFEAEMAIKPSWIGDCPITVEGWVGPRYRK